MAKNIFEELKSDYKRDFRKNWDDNLSEYFGYVNYRLNVSTLNSIEDIRKDLNQLVIDFNNYRDSKK